MTKATRGPGERAGITSAQIIQAARGLDPDSMTLQSVATRLGVDRKAIAYHVDSREGLLDLLAADAVGARLSALEFLPDDTWQLALRRAAHAAADALTQARIVAHWFRLDAATAPQTLATTDRLIRLMLDAGFSATDAARALSVTINAALGYARDVILSRRGAGHPQDLQLTGLVEDTAGQRLTALRAVAAARTSTAEADQLDFALDVIIAGLESRL